MFKNLFVLFLIVIIGCSNQPNQSHNNRVSSAAEKSQSTNGSKETAHPIKIITYQDESGSGLQTITPQLNVNDIEPLIKCIADYGTELGVGVIDKMSNKPLVRLFLKPPVRDFEEPDPKQNPFLLIKERQNYQLKKEKYDQKNHSYRTRAEAEINRFREETKLLLAQPPDASQTNIFDAISRSNLFFSEDEASQSSVKKYLVLVSDGQHNAKGVPPVNLKSGVKVILINGSASVGSLAYLQPKCFESIPSSIRYILSDASNKEGDDNANN
jgi:hypothetical protein